ncbi:MAG TPA: hypothetical protein VLH10_04760 [Yinghuangia sp.]|nr:hypothetical protein [Yinghuangia sp.]
MRRITGIAVAGLVLTGSLTACGKLDGPAGSIKEAASETTPSASTTADPDPNTSPSPSNTTRKPTSTSTTRRPTSASPTRVPITAADVPKLTVSELLAQARTAAESVRTVHVRATIKGDDGEKIFVDMNVDRETEDFYGSASLSGLTVQIVRKGDSIWRRGNEAYWADQGGGALSAEQVKYLATKHVRQSVTTPKPSSIRGRGAGGVRP